MYQVILTDIGLQKLTQAEANGTQVQFSQIAIGDGAGRPITVDSTMTALVNEVYRTNVNQVYIDPKDSSTIVIEGIIPLSAGGFWIREIGVFDTEGDLILVGNYPDSYKPDPVTEVAGFELPLLVKKKLSNTSVVQIAVDNSIVMASKEYVDNQINAHISDQNAHNIPNLKQFIHFSSL